MISPSTLLETAAPGAVREQHLEYTVRVGERVSLTTGLMHRLHRAPELGVEVRAFYYDLSESFPVLHAQLVARSSQPDRVADRLTVWTEQTIDVLCERERWDRPPLVHEERSDRWENSLIRVNIAPSEATSEWQERCEKGVLAPFGACEAFAALTLRLGEQHRRHTVLVLPLAIAQLLAEAGQDGDLPDTLIFQATQQTSERELLRAKIKQLMRTKELVLDDNALQPEARAAMTDLLEVARAWLQPNDPTQAVTLLRAMMNIMGFSAKEQDYLVLLGSTTRQNDHAPQK